MNTLTMSSLGFSDLDNHELESVEGGILPLLILGAAALLLGGCAGTTTTVKAGIGVDGKGAVSGNVGIEVQIKK